MVHLLANKSDMEMVESGLRLERPVRIGENSLRWPIHIRAKGQIDISPLVLQTLPMTIMGTVTPPNVSFTGASRQVHESVSLIRQMIERMCLAAHGAAQSVFNKEASIEAHSLLPHDPHTGASMLTLDIDPRNAPLIFSYDASKLTDASVREGDLVIVLLHVDHVWSNITKSCFGVRLKLLQIMIPQSHVIGFDCMIKCRDIINGNRHHDSMHASASLDPLHTLNLTLSTPMSLPTKQTRSPPPPPPLPPNIPCNDASLCLLPPQRRPAPPSLQEILLARTNLRPKGPCTSR